MRKKKKYLLINSSHFVYNCFRCRLVSTTISGHRSPISDPLVSLETSIERLTAWAVWYLVHFFFLFLSFLCGSCNTGWVILFTHLCQVLQHIWCQSPETKKEHSPYIKSYFCIFTKLYNPTFLPLLSAWLPHPLVSFSPRHPEAPEMFASLNYHTILSLLKYIL